MNLLGSGKRCLRCSGDDVFVNKEVIMKHTASIQTASIATKALVPLACTALFVPTAFEATEPGLSRIDTFGLALSAAAAATPAFTLAVFISNALLPIIILAFLFLFWKNRREAALLFGATALSLGTDEILKLLIMRPRPTAALVSATGFSFPSGHTAFAAGAFFMLAFIWAEHRPEHRALPWIVCGTAVALVALSRVLLGVHYVTDVAAAMPVGFAAAWIVWQLRSLKHPAFAGAQPSSAR
jgi:membrane-associated phospholipid phosphatase